MSQPHPPPPWSLLRVTETEFQACPFLSYVCLHFHSHAPSEPPLAALDLCLSDLVHGHFRGRALSRLAVLEDTSLGRVTDTALNEPASLLGTKQLLSLDQSRGRRDLMFHLAHEARSRNYAKGRGWDAWLPPLSYLTGGLSESRGL